MAYNGSNLIMRAAGAVEGTFNVWEYLSTDSLATITASGYFSDGGKRGMLVGDIVWVLDQTTPNATQCLVTSVSSTSLGGSLVQKTSATIAIDEVPQYSVTSNPRNMLDGSNASTNPWQRGTTISGIVATNTYTADRWFCVAGAASSANVAKTADTTVPRFAHSFVLTRASGQSSVSAIYLGQALETMKSYRAQGRAVTLSFWARSLSGFTATGATIGVQLSQGFGSDQSASALVNGTWTSQANVISSTQALTSTATRYQFTGNVSATATQLGVLFSFTPVGTNTGNDGIAINGVQLETVSGATEYEHRDVVEEVEACQRFFYQINEPAVSGVVAAGTIQAANSAVFAIPLPVPMRTTPTVTVVAGSFAQQVSGAIAAVSGFAAGAQQTTTMINIVSSTTATAGLGALLVARQANSGTIAASADL